MTNYTLFISDLHLDQNQHKTTELFLRFLKTEVLQADALYILGDLFKLWIGDDDTSAYTLTIKNALKQASHTLPIYIMPGNRDFLLGNRFATACGCILLADPSTINLYGKTTLLTHGDILCSGDYLHIVFRAITRPAWAIKLFLSLPFSFRACVATSMQRFSARRKEYKAISNSPTPKLNYTKIMQNFNITQLIHGHTHQAKIVNNILKMQETRAIDLGEWTNIGQYLVYTSDHTCRLETFTN